MKDNLDCAHQDRGRGEHASARLATQSQSSWLSPPRRLSLGRNEVHIWCAALDQPDLLVGRLWLVLADEEKGRANCFRSPRDRTRFVVGRGMFRRLLGLYLEEDPARLLITYGPSGKPRLGYSYGGRDTLSFNLAHCRSLVIFGVARGREIGVDLEYTGVEMDYERIAECFMSPRELLEFRKMPSSLQREAFFRCWTRKEAYVKARGEGLSLPLDQLTVSLTSGNLPALLDVVGAPTETRRWSLKDFTPFADYAAAMVVEGHDWHLHYYRVQDEPRNERLNRNRHAQGFLSVADSLDFA